MRYTPTSNVSKIRVWTINGDYREFDQAKAQEALDGGAHVRSGWIEEAVARKKYNYCGKAGTIL